MASRISGREDRGCTSRNYDVGLGACELDRRFGYSRSALRQCEFNDEVAAFNESLFLKSFPKAPDVSGGRWPNAQKADTARSCLLAACGERPTGCRASNDFYEISPAHVLPPLGKDDAIQGCRITGC